MNLALGNIQRIICITEKLVKIRRLLFSTSTVNEFKQIDASNKMRENVKTEHGKPEENDQGKRERRKWKKMQVGDSGGLNR